MDTMMLDQVLTTAAALPVDQQEMLEDLLRKRRIDAWRRETAAEAKAAARALRSGKLKPLPVEDVIARLRTGLVREAD